MAEGGCPREGRKQPMKDKDYKEIKNQVKDEFNDLIDEFFDKFVEIGNAHKETHIPTLTEIESIWGKLTSETRDLYSTMIGDAISRMDESEVIASKKENTGKRG